MSIAIPIPATQDERRRAFAGEAIPADGRQVVNVKSEADTAFLSFWRGIADEFPPFSKDNPNVEDRLFEFVYAFEPAGFHYDGPMGNWSQVLDLYAPGGNEEGLRGESFLNLYYAMLTCTRGDRYNEGIVMQNADGMIRLGNELRRRVLGLA